MYDRTLLTLLNTKTPCKGFSVFKNGHTEFRAKETDFENEIEIKKTLASE